MPGPARILMAVLVPTSIIFWAGTGSGQTVSFAPPSILPAGGDQPQSVAIGDVNGDGRPDLAVANFGSQGVSILLGLAAGGLVPATGGPVQTGGQGPYAIVAGDFNKDGALDLAVTNAATNSLSILLGTGAGGFALSGNPLPTGLGPLSLAVGDFDGDAMPDLAVGNRTDATVSVFLGNGAGGFRPAAGGPVPTGGLDPLAVAVGDFNGDGKPDLAVANAGSHDVSILRSNGDGSFSPFPGSPVPTGGRGPLAVAVGDFNRDGRLDLALANAASHDVSILRGGGAGRFILAPGGPVATGGTGPVSLVVGDLDGNGTPDLAVANLDSHDLSILLGNRAGTLEPAPGGPLPTGGTDPSRVVVGDFNGDGKPDLAVANRGSDTVSILFNTTATFGLATPILAIGADAGLLPAVQVVDGATRQLRHAFLAYDADFRGGVRVAVGDVNGDGILDVVTAPGAGAESVVKVFDGVTGALHGSGLAYPGFQGGVFVAAGDVNGDGKADIVTGAGPGAGPHVKVFDGATGAVLASFFAFDPAFQGGVRVALGDITGDGQPDLITAAGPGGGPHVRVFDGATGAVLASFFAFDPAFQGGVFVAAGDLDGDGRADLVTSAGAGGGPHVKVFSGADGGPLASFFAFEPGFSGGVRVGVVDLTGDGVGDLVTAPGPGTPALLRVFSASVQGEAGSGPVFDGFTGGVFVGGQ